jgi:hypothetical protein
LGEQAGFTLEEAAGKLSIRAARGKSPAILRASSTR